MRLAGLRIDPEADGSRTREHVRIVAHHAGRAGGVGDVSAIAALVGQGEAHVTQFDPGVQPRDHAAFDDDVTQSPATDRQRRVPVRHLHLVRTPGEYEALRRARGRRWPGFFDVQASVHDVKGWRFERGLPRALLWRVS